VLLYASASRDRRTRYEAAERVRSDRLVPRFFVAADPNARLGTHARAGTRPVCLLVAPPAVYARGVHGRSLDRFIIARVVRLGERSGGSKRESCGRPDL